MPLKCKICHQCHTSQTPCNLPDVKVGQVWKDNDRRGPDRYLRVMLLYDDGKVGCCPCNVKGNILTRRETKIAQRRFRPISTGYKLISEEIR